MVNLRERKHHEEVMDAYRSGGGNGACGCNCRALVVMEDNDLPQAPGPNLYSV